MTRLDFNLGQKVDGDGKSKDQSEQSKGVDEQTPPNGDYVITEIDLMEEEKNETKQESGPAQPTKSMDWLLVRRVAVAQIVLATISMICLLIMLAIGGVTWFKFATFFWSTFVMLAGHAGYKSYKTKNYYYVLIYLIMAAFQSLTNWFALVYSTYAIYYLDSREIRYYKGYCLGLSYKDLALFLELTETLTVVGTVITGILGAKACCAGLGRLLTRQDQIIQERSA